MNFCLSIELFKNTSFFGRDISYSFFAKWEWWTGCLATTQGNCVTNCVENWDSAAKNWKRNKRENKKTCDHGAEKANFLNLRNIQTKSLFLCLVDFEKKKVKHQFLGAFFNIYFKEIVLNSGLIFFLFGILKLIFHFWTVKPTLHLINSVGIYPVKGELTDTCMSLR